MRQCNAFKRQVAHGAGATLILLTKLASGGCDAAPNSDNQVADIHQASLDCLDQAATDELPCQNTPPTCVPNTSTRPLTITCSCIFKSNQNLLTGFPWVPITTPLGVSVLAIEQVKPGCTVTNLAQAQQLLRDCISATNTACMQACGPGNGGDNALRLECNTVY
jgi:hypothetical protein